jgi:hypothetical protein
MLYLVLIKIILAKIMQNKNNKVVIVILAILFIAFFAFLIYFLTGKNERIVETEKPKPIFPVLEIIYNAVTGNNNEGENNSTSTQEQSKNFEEIKYVRKIYDKPSAGEVIYVNNIKASTSTEEDRTIINTLVVDKATGYVYGSNSEENYVSKLISNTDFKNVTAAEFTRDGSVVAISYINSSGRNETYLGRVPQTENANLINRGMVVDARNFKSSVDSKSFIYQKIVGSGSEIYLMDLVKNTEQLLFTLPIKEINLNYNNLNQITISTKPTYTDTQKTFMFDIKTKTLSFYAENRGSINIDNKNMVSLYSDGLSIYKSGASSRVKSLADKCAFGDTANYLVCGAPKNTSSSLKYPEDWYKGKINFQDDLYLLSPSTSYEEKVLDLAKEAEEEADMKDPKIYQNILVYKNKTKGGVFMVDLEPFLEGNAMGE